MLSEKARIGRAASAPRVVHPIIEEIGNSLNLAHGVTAVFKLRHRNRGRIRPGQRTAHSRQRLQVRVLTEAEVHRSPEWLADAVRRHLDYLGAHYSCYEEGGYLWVVSPFTHIDRDLIEVTVRQLDGDNDQVNDLGETLRRLSVNALVPGRYQSRSYILSEIARSIRLRSFVVLFQDYIT